MTDGDDRGGAPRDGRAGEAWDALPAFPEMAFARGSFARDEDRATGVAFTDVSPAFGVLVGVAGGPAPPGAVEATPVGAAAVRAVLASLRDGGAPVALDVTDSARVHEVRAWPEGADGFGCVVSDATARVAEARRLDALLSLGERLRAMRDPDEVVSCATEVIAGVLGVVRVGYGTVDPTGTVITVKHDWVAPGAASLVGVHDMSGFGSFAPGMADGRLVVVTDTWSDERTEGGAFAAIGTGAMVNVPFVEDDRLRALLFVNASRPREWSVAELAFLRLAAGRMHDAVERRRAEAMLRRRADTLEDQVSRAATERDRLWTSSQDLMGVVGPEGAIVDVNPAWRTAMGWGPDEGPGLHYLDAAHPEDREATRAAAVRARDGGTLRDFVARCVARDGTVRTVSWNAAWSGDAAHVTGRDVTAARAVEEQLRQAQKMEAVGQLTGGLAHDFNNLLAGVSGGLDLATRRLSQGRVAEVGRYLDMAVEAARRASTLTHRLLAFSRRQTLDPRDVDVADLVDALAELVRRTVGPGVDLSIERATGPLVAHVDASQVDNAVLNLCINARDAMPDGGRLRIATSPVEVGPNEARWLGVPVGRYVSLAVADTGTGMPPEVAAKVFDPFFTTKPQGVGTGLGLSMVQSFAVQSGGFARVDTAPGKGTAVTLLLPRVDRAVAAGDAAAAEADLPDAVGVTVLVVDDEPQVRMVMADVISDTGARVLEAGDGASALELLASGEAVDLLVTDLGLPGGMDGARLAELARERRPGLAVLYVTGYGDRAMGDGARTLAKPFSLDELVAVVSEMTGRGARPSRQHGT